MSTESFFDRHYRVIVGVVFACALAIRLVHFGDTFVDFHPTRQFHGALIARGMYLRAIDARETPRVKAALRAQDRRGVLEPQFIERLAATSYQIAGKEHPGIVRAFVMIFWMLGGAALLGAALRLASPLGALLAASMYLFHPYAIVASESFQPDPLMMTLVCVSLFATARYDDEPSMKNALLVAVFAGMAGLVKPVGIPLIVGFHVALRLRSAGLLGMLKDKREWALGGLAALPVLIHYVGNIILGNRLKNLAGMTFRPHLLLTRKFWVAWVERLASVIGGYPLFLVVPIGIALARGRMRWALVGLLLGYFACGLTFNFHFSTHDHYQLTFFPVFALSIAAITDAILAFVKSRAIAFRIGAFALLALVCAVTLRRIVNWTFPLLRGNWAYVQAYKEIGELTHHSDNILMATDDAYGSRLEYYGGVSGNFYEIRRVSPGLVAAPKNNLAWLKERLTAAEPEYFACNPPQLLDEQPRTRKYLDEHSVWKKATPEYVLYDLVGHQEVAPPKKRKPRRPRNDEPTLD